LRRKAHIQTNVFCFAWIRFLVKVIVFVIWERCWSLPPLFGYPWHLSIPVQSQSLCDRTECRQLAICCPVNRWNLIKSFLLNIK